jgi:C1A family cysteine protease
MKRIYNVKITREPVDKERRFSSYIGTREPLPDMVDLRSKCPEIYNQGNLGSCTAQALCAAHSFCDPEFIGSRLFLYYNERVLGNSLNEDSGASISSGVESMEKHGICKEISYPYLVGNFKKKPDPECYTNALIHRTVSSKQVDNNIDEIKRVLVSGFPIVCGIAIYDSFESSKSSRTGIVDLPKEGEKLLGGHAVVIVGYRESERRFIIRNSWGIFWGDQGYFTLPYEYITSDKYCSDLWVVLKVTEDPEDDKPISKCINRIFPFLQSCRTCLF